MILGARCPQSSAQMLAPDEKQCLTLLRYSRKPNNPLPSKIRLGNLGGLPGLKWRTQYKVISNSFAQIKWKESTLTFHHLRSWFELASGIFYYSPRQQLNPFSAGDSEASGKSLTSSVSWTWRDGWGWLITGGVDSCETASASSSALCWLNWFCNMHSA